MSIDKLVISKVLLEEASKAHKRLQKGKERREKPTCSSSGRESSFKHAAGPSTQQSQQSLRSKRQKMENMQHQLNAKSLKKNKSSIIKNGIKSFLEENNQSKMTFQDPRASDIVIKKPTPMRDSSIIKNGISLLEDNIQSRMTFQGPRPIGIVIRGHRPMNESSNSHQQESVNVNNGNNDHGVEPRLPDEYLTYIRAMGGSHEMFVLQKDLKAADMRPGNDRLLCPDSLFKTRFLHEREMSYLIRQEGQINYPAIRAKVIQPPHETGLVSLRRWNMSKSARGTYQCYVLNSGWYEQVAKRNGLKVGDVIQLWSFRDRNSEICFALVVV